MNTTIITLIHKTKCLKNVNEFRPLSCCNTLYKCVTEVICGRLRKVLPDLIMENQGGFIHGRYIAHNIMVIQDPVKHYERKTAKPNCLLKIDIDQKAYDTVNWEFLKEMMLLEFPGTFIELIQECVTTPTFSLMLNGNMTCFFKSLRGLRQCDPILDLLFVLCMEYLSRILTNMGELELFQFYPRCKK